MRDLIISVGNQSADQAALSQALGTAASNIASNFASFYSADTSAAFTRNFLDFTTSSTGIVKGIFEGATGITPSQTLNTTSINNLATLLSTTSPTSYTLQSATAMFTNISNYWQNQATARKAGNWSDDITAASNAEEALISGGQSTPGFADMYTNALFLDWPNRF